MAACIPCETREHGDHQTLIGNHRLTTLKAAYKILLMSTADDLQRLGCSALMSIGIDLPRRLHTRDREMLYPGGRTSQLWLQRLQAAIGT